MSVSNDYENDANAADDDNDDNDHNGAEELRALHNIVKMS